MLNNLAWARDFKAYIHGIDLELINPVITMRFEHDASKDKEWKHQRLVRTELLTSLLTEFRMKPINS